MYEAMCSRFSTNSSISCMFLTEALASLKSYCNVTEDACAPGVVSI